MSLCISFLFFSTAIAQADWEVGAGIHDITGPAGDTFLVGYGTDFPVKGIHTRLWSRAFVVKEANSDERIVFVSTDLHSIPTEVKFRVIDLLQADYGEFYKPDNVMLTATHTHSGPGGFHNGSSMLSATSGSDSFNVDVIVDGVYRSISEAHKNLKPALIDIGIEPLHNITRNEAYRHLKII